MCYVDWAITAHNKIVNAKPDNFFKEKIQYKVSKYRESIVNVIGHAIADCVTKQKEFANPGDRKNVNVITFATNPTGYSRANWNAVILYNLVYLLLRNQQQNIDDINTDDVFEQIKNDLLIHYKNNGISDLSDKLDLSIKDIKEYNKQLDLAEEIIEFIPENAPESWIETPHHIESKDMMNKHYDNIMSKTFKLPPEAKASMNFFIKRKVTMQPCTPNTAINFMVDLTYTPKDNVGEQWSLKDNGTLQMGNDEKGKKGYFQEVIPYYLFPIVNCFIQFVECDLELDASALRDLRYWSDYKGFDYHGKKLNLKSIDPKSLDPEDIKYRTKDYNVLIQKESTRAQYFTSYKQMDPSKRAMKAQD